MSPKIWVPEPASKLYGVDKGDPQTMRDRMVREYGEGTVQRCELAVLLDLAMLTGQIRPDEFMYVMSVRLAQIDQQRRAAAGLESDKG
jgi:hypothetical protein